MDAIESKSSFEKFIDSIEELSKLQRILISVGILLAISAVFIYFIVWPKFDKIKTLKANLNKVEQKLQVAKRNAANLAKFQQKMREAEVQFKIAMRALPEKEEIPSLLTSISKSGQDVGLEFLLFEPKSEVKKDFYAEIPVAMNVIGGYHDLAIFFDKVARLSRIVNIVNIDMARSKGGSNLNTTCTAVTYKFIEPAPASQQPAKNKSRKKSKK